TLVASPGFDASVWEIWPYLTAGASLHVPPEAVRSEPAALAAWLVRERITITFLPTPLAEAVLEEGPHPPAPSPGPPSTPSPGEGETYLRYLLTGGDALHRGADEFAPFELVNHYGPTENTVVATATPVARGSQRPPIGRPISNVRVYVLDPRFQPQPVGVPGELCVGGGSLARGYLNRPDLTAERFVPDPFGDGRLYRTGDRVRYLPDGSIDFLGRVDFQVKVRGFRIELGEVEAALREHPAVREAAAAVRDEPCRLIAYVAAEDRDGLRGELQEMLTARLPSYMVPSAFVVLPELPVGAHGKIDRAALPAPEKEAGSVEPRTMLERQLAAMWTDFLPGGPVGVHDGFFERGGHSLLATRLLARVGRELMVEVPLGRFLQAPTVAELARRVAEGGGFEALTPQRREISPLSFPQRRLWFLEQLEPGTAVYNVPLIWRLSGPLDVPSLERSLAEVVRRHEILRTVFRSVDGEPVQSVLPSGAWKQLTLPVIDVRESEADRLIREESRRPFDLGSGLLLRPLLLCLGPQEHRLLLNLHHIACDGPSAGVLARELETLYAGLPLPELPLQYADFAEWQVRHLRGPGLEALLAHWRKRLEGIDGLEGLPTDRLRPPVQSYRGDHLAFELPAEVLEPLEALARGRGASLFTVLLAGFLSFLQKHTGGGEVAVGTPVANRDRAELEPLIGMFSNTLVLRADLKGDPGFLELLERVRVETLEALAHRDLPFEKLVEELQPRRDQGRNPLFDVLFSYREGEIESLRLPGLSVEQVDSGTGTAKFDLSLSVSRSEGRLRLRMEYATDLFDRATAERMAARLTTLFTALAEDPGRHLSELPILDEAERAQLASWDNAAYRGHPQGLLHGLFEDQARRTPEAVALVALRGEIPDVLTYSELEERSARLAGRLRAQGAGPEVGVAVCLERTADLVVTLLAVLRSGSFYVPLDPRYPKERLDFLIEDSGAPIVVTQLWLAAERLPSPVPPAEVSPGNLAYLIYTSGSTGRPKAVAIEHRSAFALACWAREAFSPEELRGVLASTAVTFDLSVFELFATLAWGGTVILAENALELPRLELPEGVEVTLVNTVPSAMSELLRGELPASVRTINLAGEALLRRLADRAYAQPGINRVCNLYGPSEDTTYSTWTAVDCASNQPPSIGWPVHDTRAYVLDRRQERLPVGVPGELYLAGAGLARGYLGRPDLTAERFVPDPFASEPGARMYRTGDQARQGPDGLNYLGRLDNQVKVRGFRIEPAEVEAVLVRQPGVESALVLARDQRLVAYLVASGVSAPELRQALLKALPEPMVPSAFVFLDAFPLTPHGKVDRRALPAPDAVHATAEFVPPRTAVERDVAQVWAEVLGIERVGTDDSFWDLGGHSLLATRMLARLEAAFDVRLPLKNLFAAPTLAGLSALLSESVLANQGEAEVDNALAELGELSDEEVRALLDQTVRELESMA
ncbi:MAG TPA: amino acid adenylation domain-containing protein, partial [Thermoanaerobaculia bacterium]|nr:amino acid adenylation domain-containing protein [Thermoanaerobaculia bacterium]